MTITKFEHACYVIEEQGKRLVIDPGTFSPSFKSAPNVVAIVITHAHSDHMDPEKIRQIITDNPEVKIFSVQEVANELTGIEVQVVRPGEGIHVEPFRLEFYGGEHAVIHESRPTIQNVGVFVNDTFYYPGDSFAKPDKPVQVLALPAAAPWMKIGEAIDYVRDIKAEINIPTHDAVLSEIGQKIYDSMLQSAAESCDAKYQRLATGESITA